MNRYLSSVLIVGATIACSSAWAAPLPNLRLCTGASAKNYFFAGNVLKKNAASAADITVVETTGSANNLDKMMNGECDAAFVQADALKNYSNRNAAIIPKVQVSGPLYDEYAHLICARKANIKTATDLKKNNVVFVGDPGSGSSETWSSFVQDDKPVFGPVQTSGLDDIEALNSVSGGQGTCAFYVMSVGSPLMKNDARQLADKLVLVPIDDDKLQEEKDAFGQPLYKTFDLPSDQYGPLMPSGWFSNKSVKTVAIEAQMIVNIDWKTKNQASYNNVLRALNRSVPEIKKRTAPNE